MNARGSDTLNRLLKKSQVFGCEYDDQLSNHLPMALIALDRIGASEQDLTAFFESHSPRLSKQAEDGTTINIENWREHLGKHLFNSAYRSFFLTELKAKGVRPTLAAFLPILIPGVSGGAFHPLIRLAYALEIESEWEIAEALASWCMAYLELGKIPEISHGSPSNLVSSLAQLARTFKESPIEAKGENVFIRLASVSATPAFSSHFSSLNLSKLSMNDLAAAAIKFYSSTKDSFVGLHCVTSTHALRRVTPFFQSKQSMIYLWQGISAAYLSVKCPPLKDSFVESSPLPTWEKIFTVGRSHKNDHVIKFIYTAHEEFHFYKNVLYHETAAKKAGLISW